MILDLDCLIFFLSINSLPSFLGGDVGYSDRNLTWCEHKFHLCHIFYSKLWEAFGIFCKNFSNHNSNNEKVLIIGLKTLYRLMSWPWTYVVARISKCIHLYTCPLLIVSCLNQLCCFLFRELMQHSSEISDVCSWDNCSEYDLRILCSCMTW